MSDQVPVVPHRGRRLVERTLRNQNLLISVERGVLLRIEAAAILLGIGRTTMYDLIGRGRIPVVRIGRRTLVHRDDLERFAGEIRGQQSSESGIARTEREAASP
jgi:excisionase family DNA binding protein